MALGLVSSPTYPVVGDTVTLSLSGASGSTARFEVTSVPAASSTVLGLLEDDSFTPDVDGAYGFALYDESTTYGVADYDGSATSGTRTILVASGTATLYVGTALDLPVVTATGDGGTLRLVVHNTTVRAASFSSTTTEVGRLAALDSTVLTKLAALVDVAATSVADDLPTGATTLRTKMIAHFADATEHVNADTINTLLRYQATSDAYTIDLVNEEYDRLRGHTQQGSLGARIHANDDGSSTMVTARALTIGAAFVTWSDIAYRVYERHRVLGSGATPAIHATADGDTTNTMPTGAPLTQFVVAYLDALATNAPAAVTGENTGALNLAHKFGFRKATT